MRSVTLITGNVQKAKEIAQALLPYGIKLKHRALNLPELQAATIQEVIAEKVETAYRMVKQPVLVDDTGIFFHGYKNFPGVFCRFVYMSLGFEGLLRLIEPGQAAYFSSFIAFKSNKNEPARIFNGKCVGTLTKQVHGKIKHKMPYDNIFIPKGDTRTFAEMGVANKQQYDHRSKAVRKFARYYLTNYQAEL
ncbi:MAG: non-canonical purine NTP pyrophosphatase [Patescibacteria group bacterium]|jgi:XTP/dITP diphosphohydrolase